MSVLVASVLGVLQAANAFGSGRVAPKATVITVTMGKPSEFKFTLSRYSKLPAGRIIFKVTNKGVLAHDFKVCTSAFTATTLANECVGPKTKVLKKGQTATLTVTLKKGKFQFLSTLPGHAKNGMKGLLGVGVTVTQPPEPLAYPECNSARTCTNLVFCKTLTDTTVTVDMTDSALTLSPSTIPCGRVTLIERNLGSAGQSFSIGGHLTGAVVPPGGTASVTVTLPPGSFGVWSAQEVDARFFNASTILTVTP
jgi:uncharacterized cupredoxin-like copper-binding protein